MNIQYIQAPAHLGELLKVSLFDPKIPLPVESGPPGEVQEITLEAVLSAILHVVSEVPPHRHQVYYRELALALRPSLPAELSQAGAVKAETGDYALAEEIFKAWEGLCPEEPRAWLNLALLYEQQAAALAGREEDKAALESKKRARDYYKRALEAEPPLPEAFYNAAFFHLSEGLLDRAIQNFETYLSLETRPERTEKAKNALAAVQARQRADLLFKGAYDAILMGQEEEGVAKARSFLEAQPEVWNAWFLVGWGLRRLGRYAEGRQALEKAHELAPAETDVSNELAICCLESGDLKSARRHLEAALRREPENVKLICNLGLVAQKDGRLEDARGFFETVLEIDPEDKIARLSLERLSPA